MEVSKEELIIDELKMENPVFTDFRTSELADFLNDSPEYSNKIIMALEPHRAVKTMKFLDIKLQKKLIHTLPSNNVATLIQNMHFDDRTALLSELTSESVKKLVLFLPHEDRIETLALLGYQEDSVGRLMNPDYIEVKSHYTVQDALNKIRRLGRTIENINFIYIIDENEKLIDDINLKELLITSPDTKISALMDTKYLALHVNDDQETAASVFRKNNRAVLPVTDDNGVLLGIVTIDDILRVESEEATEDIQKIGGTEALDEPYMNTPFFDLIKKRAPWLVILFIGEMLTASAMAFFEDEIAKAIVLVLFIPLIISSGGNSGSQASTLIIRAMALGEITFEDWWRVMRREIMSGIVLGSILGFIGFLRIIIWNAVNPIYGEHYILVGITVGVTLIFIVLWGTLCGAMLPIVIKKLGFDPATSSAPFVATLVDVTGLVIYFIVASLLLSGSLL
ncbi:MAG TPA: magnesium transporter [Chitinophagales bacterium]|nr:magnesium transporter [Chitinophagales bacterium]HMW11945.1 magnesium transporter [Chitinophagales bacterium]HMX59571.1 magnesium transporter [Chitinophagales bacterium]HMY23261.1 magnesium transporter [Chitinophagales bacterium]HMZ33032.1 magnesium transporter [Chitinophagales bacterium]